MRSRGLNKKHRKALELLKTTSLPVCEIAKQSGISKYHLYDLVKGNEKAGAIASEFHASYQSHMDSIDTKMALESKLLIEMVLSKLSMWVESVSGCPARLKIDERKHMIEILKLLNNMPSPATGAASYPKAITLEEIASEFARLHAISRSFLNNS